MPWRIPAFSAFHSGMTLEHGQSFPRSKKKTSNTADSEPAAISCHPGLTDDTSEVKCTDAQRIAAGSVQSVERYFPGLAEKKSADSIARALAEIVALTSPRRIFDLRPAVFDPRPPLSRERGRKRYNSVYISHMRIDARRLHGTYVMSSTKWTGVSLRAATL